MHDMQFMGNAASSQSLHCVENSMGRRHENSLDQLGEAKGVE